MVSTIGMTVSKVNHGALFGSINFANAILVARDDKKHVRGNIRMWLEKDSGVSYLEVSNAIAKNVKGRSDFD